MHSKNWTPDWQQDFFFPPQWPLAVLQQKNPMGPKDLPGDGLLLSGDGGTNRKSGCAGGLLWHSGGEPKAGNCCRFSSPMWTSGTGLGEEEMSVSPSVSPPVRSLRTEPADVPAPLTFALLLVLLHLDPPLPALLLPHLLLPLAPPLLQLICRRKHVACRLTVHFPKRAPRVVLWVFFF